jgi:hypothetical protein
MTRQKVPKVPALVDVRRVDGVGQLERRATRLQDCHPTAGRGVARPLGQAQHVPVEVQRFVVVGRCHDEAQLEHR